MNSPDWGLRARATTLLFFSVFSACLGLAQVARLSELEAFAALNEQALRSRLVVLLIAAVIGSGVVAWVWHGSPSNHRDVALARASRVFGPLVVAAFLPPLFVRDLWRDREIAHLLWVGVLALLVERLLGPSLEVLTEWWRRRGPAARIPAPVFGWIASAVVAGLVGYYWLRVGHLTNLSHQKMATMSSDLAEFDNLFFNALHGHPFRAPAIEGQLQNWSALKVHAEFGLYFLLPFYALAPGPEALLWIQAGLVALTAVPVFLLARARLGSFAGVVFVGAFLLMPAVERPNFYDFHFTPLGMLFVAWLLFFLDALARQPERRWPRVGTALAFGLALLSREDVAIGLAVLGGFLLLSGALVRVGSLMMVSAVSYFALMKFSVMPHFGTMWFDTIYNDLKASQAKGFGAVLLTLFTNPGFVVRSLLTEPKLLYFLHMTVPVLALWLRKPLLWFALLTGFVSTLLVTNRPPMFQSSFQYTYLWVPYVVVASILSLSPRGGVLARPRTKTLASLLALALAALAVGYQHGILLGGKHIIGGFVDKTFEVTPTERAQLASLRALIGKIPRNASVAATEAEGPHVSTRLVMYSLKFTLGHEPDYLLLGGVRGGGERAHVVEALDSGKYGVVAEDGPFLLLQRGADPATSVRVRRRLGRR